jgi:hypothetical protein
MVEEVGAIIAGVALIVSIIVFVDSRLRELRAARLARKPALIFAWDHQKQTWILTNIGSGPALDVVIVQRIKGEWGHPLRMPEMAVQDENIVPRRWYEYWDNNPGLGARYRSITDEIYSTKTASDRSEIREGSGDFPPELDTQIEPHWRYRE